MVSIGELDENGRLKPTKQDNGDLTWVATCETCSTRVHASVNGGMTEAAAKLHAKEFNHTVIVGMEFAGSLLGTPKPLATVQEMDLELSPEERAQVKADVAEKMEDIFDAGRILYVRCHWRTDRIARVLDMDEAELRKELGLPYSSEQEEDLEVEQRAWKVHSQQTGRREEW